MNFGSFNEALFNSNGSSSMVVCSEGVAGADAAAYALNIGFNCFEPVLSYMSANDRNADLADTVTAGEWIKVEMGEPRRWGTPEEDNA